MEIMCWILVGCAGQFEWIASLCTNVYRLKDVTMAENPCAGRGREQSGLCKYYKDKYEVLFTKP